MAKRAGPSEDAIVLEILDAVEGDASVTQRNIANRLGIALGLANTYVKRCVRKGLLKVSKVPARRYAYYLTQRGFAEKSRLVGEYLAASFDFLRKARDELSDLFAAAHRVGQSRLVLLGEGDLADVALIVAQRSDVTVVAILPVVGPELNQLLSSVHFDLAIVTSTESPQQIYDTAVGVLGRDRVLAPAMLRIRDDHHPTVKRMRAPPLAAQSPNEVRGQL